MTKPGKSGRASGQAQILDKKGYISVPQARLILGVHYCTLYRWIDAKKIDGVRIGRNRYVRKSSLVRFLSGNHPLTPWLLGLRGSSECRICAAPIPIGEDLCWNCETVDVKATSLEDD